MHIKLSSPGQTQVINSRGTGDASNLMLYIGIFIATLTVGTVFVYKKKQRN